MNGAWHSEAAYPIPRTQPLTLYLGEGVLITAAQFRIQNSEHLHPWRCPPGQVCVPAQVFTIDTYPHRPTLGTRAALCWGSGAAPNGLARDLRPDEALSLTYTSPPLTDPLDIIGFPETILYLSSSAPVAHLVARLTDVAPDGTSAPVSAGILNLTHRYGHTNPQPLQPDEIYEIHLPLKAAGYRFLPGHCLRLSIASAYWPVIWPSPYPATNQLHRGPAQPSRLILPVVPDSPAAPPPPTFKTTPPQLIDIGRGYEEPPVWQIIEDVIKQSVTVKIYGGDTSILPGDSQLFTSELLEMTAYHHDPAHARLYNEVVYQLEEYGYEIYIRSTGTIRSTETDLQVDLQLLVTLNGNPFFQKSWLESIPRQWL
jgi:hypothetical protein